MRRLSCLVLALLIVGALPAHAPEATTPSDRTEQVAPAQGISLLPAAPRQDQHAILRCEAVVLPELRPSLEPPREALQRSNARPAWGNHGLRGPPLC